MLAGPPKTVKRARQLRRSMSVPEVMLWMRLRARPGGFKFRRQHPAGGYILDFFCNEAGLAIEVDGIGHDMGDRPARDMERDRWLLLRGVQTLRLPAHDISISVERVVETIVAACAARANPLHDPADGPPPQPGEESA